MLERVYFQQVNYTNLSNNNRQNQTSVSGLNTLGCDVVEIKDKNFYNITVLSFKSTSNTDNTDISLRPLKDKKILIGITGGIAAYKIPELISKLTKAGADVKVIMTPNAKEFVTENTLRTMSKNPVYCEQFDVKDWRPEHVNLAKNHDLMIVAPATANTISKLAHGTCDNLLTTTATAFNKQILVAPAMNSDMLTDHIVQKNLEKLKNYSGKYTVMDCETGYLACGDEGKGRMAEVDTIIHKAADLLNTDKYLKGKTIVITAGGTRERIDPVRYITNDSSGKMGFALADLAHHHGAKVILISTIDVNKPYEVVKVESTRDLLEATKEKFMSADGLIMAAAPADYRPQSQAGHKIKREQNPNLTLELVENPDILKEIAKIKKPGQVVIGFAAESDDLIKNAQKKIISKNLDYIVANDISRKDTGFRSDDNEATLIPKDGAFIPMPKMSKVNMAEMILREVFKTEKQ